MKIDKELESRFHVYVIAHFYFYFLRVLLSQDIVALLVRYRMILIYECTIKWETRVS